MAYLVSDKSVLKLPSIIHVDEYYFNLKPVPEKAGAKDSAATSRTRAQGS